MLAAVDASVELRDGTRLLDAACVEIRRGELIIVVGPSGSGKTTLLETLAGIRTATSGGIEFGTDALPLGYVPQDDIVHRDLTVRSTIRYAARLRMPSGTSAEDIDLAVDRTLHMLGLWERHKLTVGALSGGQRKRASIATELVVQPKMLLLDEPTAGLDPASSASLMGVLRGLADTGTAIIMTTHNLADLNVADRLIVMADGGRIVFDGPPSGDGADVAMSAGDETLSPRRPLRPSPPDLDAVDPSHPDAQLAPRSLGRPHGRQCAVLARRNVELMARNRMSLAIMAGSPLLIVAMFVTLFPTNHFDATASDRTAAIAIVYWLAFAGFFFGLTFGLLQICTELPIVRRERLVAIDLGPYLLAKVIVLVPILGFTNLIMIATLSFFDRLPTLDAPGLTKVWLVLALDSLAGLTLGLLASAAVASTAQAALALPMLCFPAVLFSGAVLPVSSMAFAGRVLATFTSDRWAFEALARTLDIGRLPARAAGLRPIDLHGGALSGPTGMHTLVLLAFAAVFISAARLVLERRSR